ncbi:HAAAP family serine/threonine permease [Endozoicomonadaceae bacterium StTr2]
MDQTQEMMQGSVSASNAAASTGKKRDMEWMLALFGTAVGAGVLFLPINAGLGGIWPLIAMTVLVGPMTFLAHRGLTRFCLSSSNPDGNITDAVVEHFGPKAGSVITVGYFASIFPILMIYGIGITNTVNSLIINQLGMTPPPRLLLSFVLVVALVGVMVAGQKLVLKVTQAIVYPLIAVLLGVSLYLVPEWNGAQFDAPFNMADFFKTMFVTIPVLVFAFNHSPAVSSFASAYRKDLGDNAEPAASRTLLRTSMLLTGFVMFFVFSCVLTLSPAELAQVKNDNIAILSYFAQRTDNNLFGWLAQIVALVAISSSFFGHYMGSREGLNSIVVNVLKKRNPKAEISEARVNRFSMMFITLAVWAIAYANVSVMGMIEALVAPILAMILFVMPVLAVKKIPALRKYESGANTFTLIMGIITITGFIASNFFM